MPSVTSPTNHTRPRSRGTVEPAFSHGDQWLLAALATPLQLVCLYMVPLVFECDAAVYFNYSPASTYRAPLFAALLLATGQHHLHSFAGTLLAHAAFGVLSPILVYRTLAPMTRYGALGAAILYIVSLVPFTAAKLMLAEQLFTIVLLTTIYFLSRYYYTRRQRFIYLTMGFGLGSMFTRWEAQFVLLACMVALLALCWTVRRHLAHWMVCVAVVGATCLGWSYARARVLNDRRVFGTLQNGTADQLFWHLYVYMGPEIYQWERILDPAVDAERRNALPDAPSQYRLITLDNGPATRRLAQTIREIARRRPSETVFLAQTVQPNAGGYLTRLQGDPDRLVAEIFGSPNQTYVFSVPSEIRAELGPRDAERLLMAVNLEAIRRHPGFFASKLSVALTMVGVSVDAGSFMRGIEVRRHTGTPAEGRFRDLPGSWPVMRQWSDFHYANVPYNLGNCATATLPSRMVDEYRWDADVSNWRPIERFVSIASTGRNLLRNIVGPIALLTWWLIPFSRCRAMLLAIAISTAALVGVYSVLGGGAYTRYEYAVLPLMLLGTVGSLCAIGELWSRLRRRNPGHAPTPGFNA